MRQPVTRRATLAALGTVAVAGCSFGDDRYWSDPPPFDDSRLDSVTDRQRPDRRDPIPVSITTAALDAVTARVEELLSPIPEPLGVGTVPNGKVRGMITAERRAARQALDRMREAPATLPTAAAAADARASAAEAAGIWAAIVVGRSPTDVTLSAAATADAIGRLASDLPAVAASPQEAAVVYGAVGWWLDRAERSTLVGDRPVPARPDPLRVGRATGNYERVRGEVEIGDHLRERYVASLDYRQPVAEDLRTAVAELAPASERRLASLHEPEDEERLYRPPSGDEILSRDVPRDHPGRRLLSRNVSSYRGEPPYRPIAWPGHDPDFPALEVRATHRAFAVLDAVETIAERIDDGDDIHPPDAATVREAREEAIDAVAGLGESESPLERWVGWALASAFENPDRRLAAADDGHREPVRAHSEYVWIRTVADRVPSVTAEVNAAVDG